MARIDGHQDDIHMRPLGAFLFSCEFYARKGDKVLSEKVIKKLNYSVVSLNLPRMEAESADSMSYGSFFVTFPFWATGKKDIEFDFFETDEMEITKLFYHYLNQGRWKATTMLFWGQADLYVRVAIYDQRNTFGIKKREIFSHEYALKTKEIGLPEFVRTGEVTLLKTKVTFNSLTAEYSHGNLNSPVNAAAEMQLHDKEPDPAVLNTEELGNRIAAIMDPYKEKYGSNAELGPDGKQNANRDYNHAFTTDNISSNQALRAESERLGKNSFMRMVTLAGNDKEIDHLRQVLREQGVNVNDYSEVSDALVDMGVFGKLSNGYCQRGVSVLEAIVSGNTRVKAPTASSSRAEWEAAGFKETESRKVSNVSEINDYITSLANSGKIREGDKIIIDYDSSDKEAGHAVTVLYDKEKGWYTTSDSRQNSMAGLALTHKVDEVHVMRMTDAERSKRASFLPSGNETKADMKVRLNQTIEDRQAEEINDRYKNILNGKK